MKHLLLLLSLSLTSSLSLPWIALITGGGTGMGRSQAIALARQEGVHVIITGRRREPLQQVQNEVGGPEKCTILDDCDIGRIDSWERIRDAVEGLGGNLCFVGNTAGSYGPWDNLRIRYDEIDNPQTILDYNTAYVSGIQLGYHYLVPWLRRGSAARNKPSVVLNASSSSSSLPRGMAKLAPLYIPAKNAVEAITRCAYGMYKDPIVVEGKEGEHGGEGHGGTILTYGISPVVYRSEMTDADAAKLGWTVEQFCAFVNPLPATGDPDDVGEISAALFLGNAELEGGIHYVIMPVPDELQKKEKTEEEEEDSSPPPSKSILFSSSVYGDGIDSLDGGVMRIAHGNIQKAYWSNGQQMDPTHLAKIKDAMEAHRVASLP
jgi:NAD(P)-dependent dehydrogenase (short-subunit alcohol dehydrogenase family)